jgi:hypothetical protein
MNKLQAFNKGIGGLMQMDETEVRELLKRINLLSSADVAKQLNWDVRKVSVYNERGVLPKPIIYIGSRPAWTQAQINSFKGEGNK